MAPRRSHKKSRNGCAQCKRRKLKCNEQHPQCNNCISHAIECEFSKQSHQLPSPIISEINEDIDTAPSRPKLTTSISTPSLDLTGDGLFTKQLELMYHYVSETCWTLSPDPIRQQMWKSLPEIAWSNEFLLHCILAVSAQHISYTKENGEVHGQYARLARHYQDLSFKAAQSAMANVTPANSPALCAYFVMVLILTFASKTESNILLSSKTEPSANWLHHLRGSASFFCNNREWAQTGGITMKLDEIFLSAGGPLPADLVEQLDNLERFCSVSVDGENARSTYQHVISKLRWSFSMNCGPTYHQPLAVTAFMWPATLPQSFQALLDLKRPEALAILAHFAIILSSVENYWWGEGLALRLVTVIQDVMPEPWKCWAMWPKEQIIGAKPLQQSMAA